MACQPITECSARCIEMKESMELKHQLEMSTVQMAHESEMKKLQNTMQRRHFKEIMNVKTEYKKKLQGASESHKTELQNCREAMDMKYNEELANIREDYQHKIKSNLTQMQMDVRQMKAKWQQTFEDHQAKTKQLQQAYDMTKVQLNELTEEYDKATVILDGKRQQHKINGAAIDTLFVDHYIRAVEMDTSNDNEEIVKTEADSNIFHADDDETASNYDADLLNISVLESPIEPIPVEMKPLCCQIDGCFKEFRDEPSLETHLRIHAILIPFTCRGCGLFFTVESNLKEHTKSFAAHPFKCSIDGCGKQVKRQCDLTRHIWDHEGKERPWKCTSDNCEQRSYTQSSLHRHMATHANELPHKMAKKQRFHCKFSKCDYVAGHQKDLIRHKTKHSGAEPWPCEYLNCGKMFAHQSHLTGHMKTHAFKR